MTGEKDKNSLDEYRKIKSEMLFDKVNKIFRENPDNYIQKLEEIGFDYHEEEDYEKIEEDDATPQNDRQEYLVAYFDGKHELCEKTLRAFLQEHESAHPNYPLIRKYFKAANQRLKDLLLFGLDQDPINIDLLNDLSFFHEFRNILEELVNRFISACRQEKNLLNFSEIVQDFYYATEPDSYDALSKLKELFPPDTEKGENIEFVVVELLRNRNESGHIEF
ncbi:MAG: hypothetical protein HF982_11715 [Desulfobacteraceae bacterium]|nr:hypothetical protein [Desulfobacteraceae bacterium]MBC2720230.1 hypothetical protein [Desulfobacteraceae bacterium]